MSSRLQSHWGFTRMPFGKDLAPLMLHTHRARTPKRSPGSPGASTSRPSVSSPARSAPARRRHRASTPPRPRAARDHLPAQPLGRGPRNVASRRGRVGAGALDSTPRPWHPKPPKALAAEHAERGRTPVVVIDEAHLLDNTQMEALRMLTNHDMDSGSPFAAALIGQPTLRQRLRLGVLAALDQRITVRYALTGMTAKETSDYITHHVKIAGRSDTLFSDDAITLIHNASRGYPRAVNNLADQRPHRGVRPQSQHRRRESHPHRHLRDRRRLTLTPPTTPSPARRRPRQPQAGGALPYIRSPAERMTASICKINAGQHRARTGSLRSSTGARPAPPAGGRRPRDEPQPALKKPEQPPVWACAWCRRQVPTESAPGVGWVPRSAGGLHGEAIFLIVLHEPGPAERGARPPEHFLKSSLVSGPLITR